MKRYVILFFILSFFAACNDGKKESRDKNEVQFEETENPSDTVRHGTNGEIVEETATEKDGVETESIEEDSEIAKTPSSNSLEGTYTKLDPKETTAGCACYCLDISFSMATQLCISPENITVSARFSRKGDNMANVYFVEVLTSKNVENEIPWDTFDTTVPIATVSLQPDGSLKLDWLGFSVNGKIAVDYAIYGKKTLEGNYKRK